MFSSEFYRILSKFFLCLACILVLPLGISIYYEFIHIEGVPLPYATSLAFVKTMGICLLLSGGMWILRRLSKDPILHRKESIFLVVAIWFLSAGIGSLPFIFTKALTNPIDAYFEAMSGLTTTGATILQPKVYDPQTGKEIAVTMTSSLNPHISYTFFGTVAPLKDLQTGEVLKEGIEALGKPLLFWRSFLQWVGGIGIVVLFITVLPSLALGGKFLYESEVSGPIKERLLPRIKETGALFLKIYGVLTLLLILLLFLCNPKIPVFDATALSLSTISTGGFTIYNQGLEQYLSLASKGVLMIFMILGSVNFSLYFYLIQRKTARLRDPEFFYYMLSLACGCALISLNLWYLGKQGGTFLSSLLEGSFQAISAQTSTGYSIANYDLWPIACQFLLIILMYIGGMSGSTSGGIKMVRFLILFKAILYKIESFFRPSVVRVLKIGSKEIAEKTVMNVFAFLCITVFLVILGTYLLLLDKVDLITSLGVISSTISNAGLNFGGIGSTASLGFLSNFSKIVAILWMVLGRLEFFSVLVLLVPSFWRDK